MIIKLTNTDNSAVYLNPDAIIWVRRDEKSTSIRMVEEQWATVLETPEKIVDVIKGLQRINKTFPA